MRNVFDQYEQPENRLTHALMTTLDRDRHLVRPFLRWLGVPVPPSARSLRVTEQRIPGDDGGDEEKSQKGIPDGCIFTEDGWALLLESKVQAAISPKQLQRHLRTARRHGYENPFVVLLAVDRPRGRLPQQASWVAWREVYAWFARRARSSWWARTLVRYMEVFEGKMLTKDYGIKGTLTMFDGLRFDDDEPYTYREGKRLIRLLGDELQGRKDLLEIGVDPKGARRPAITGRGGDMVWDFLPLKAARHARAFTHVPHLSLGINRLHATARITVPNGVHGGFKSKLKHLGRDGFRKLMAELESRLRPVIKKSPGAAPTVSVLQRHYPGRHSTGIVDGRLDVDLRTVVPDKQDGVAHQPQWMDAIHSVLTNKKSNMQMSVGVHFEYSCPRIRSPKAVDLFAETWIALSPLLDFVLEGINR